MTDENPFHLFNIKTMSGIHPGSRTAQTNLIRWRHTQGESGATGWARVLWPGDQGDAEVYLLENGQNKQLLRQPGENDHKPVFALLAELAAGGHQPSVCGTCQHWQPLGNAASTDGIPFGLCSWQSNPANAINPNKVTQSALALECLHWHEGRQTQTAAPLAVESDSVPAEVSAPGWWATLKRRLTGEPKPRQAAERGGQSTGQFTGQFDEQFTERSGVGAGTERCLACSGRIANLGALTFATESDDTRTVSVWRCRLCHTYYLNDWVDRWVRLDSLETEESYFRLAPSEASDLLALFGEKPGGEHPKERHTRGAQQTQVDAFLADRPRLLHQIKQGR